MYSNSRKGWKNVTAEELGNETRAMMSMIDTKMLSKEDFQKYMRKYTEWMFAQMDAKYRKKDDNGPETDV